MTRYHITGAAVQTTVSGSVASSGAVSITIGDASGWPDASVGPYACVIDPGQPNEEVVLVTARAGAVLTVTSGNRGWDGTTSAGHSNGAVIYPCIAATYVDEANLHQESSALHLGAGTVKTAHFEAGAVDAAAIASSAVTETKLGSGAVTSTKIASSAVTEAAIASSAVTEAKIGSSAVSAGKLAADAVTTVKILNANVTTAKLADGAVNSAKLADGAVTAGKIGDLGEWTAYTPVWNGTIGDGTIEGAYQKIGRTVHWRVHMDFGSSTSFTSAGWTITLPVAPRFTGTTAAVQRQGIVGHAAVFSSGTSTPIELGIVVARSSGGVDASMMADPYGGSTGAWSGAGNPHIWSSAHSVTITGTYEAAS